MCFLYNAQQLKINDERKIKDIFGPNFIPSILVNNVENLIGV